MAVEDFDDVDGAAEELLKRWAPSEEKKAPAKAAPPTPPPVEEEVAEEEYEEAVEEDEAASEEEHDAEPGTLAEDEHEVEVDGKRLKIAELKLLAAKQAEITSKYDAAVQAAQKAVEEHQKHSTAVNALLERAKAKWEPFSKIDFMVAQNQLNADEFAQLRSQAAAAYQDVQFFEQELDKSVKSAQESQKQALMQSAQECIKVLSDAKTGIKDWGQKVYQEMRTYALGSGVEPRDFDMLTNPAAFKMMHKAMLYDKGQKSAMKKVVTAPKNVNKTPTGGASSSPAKSKVQAAMATLRKTGDPDAAAEALMARWAQ